MAYVTSVPHLGEVFLNINCRVPYLWRTVDQDGEVLDIWSKATEIGSCQEVLSQIIKGIAVVPRVIITDNAQGAAASPTRVTKPRIVPSGACT